MGLVFLDAASPIAILAIGGLFLLIGIVLLIVMAFALRKIIKIIRQRKSEEAAKEKSGEV